jgi:hypothetical protein
LSCRTGVPIYGAANHRICRWRALLYGRYGTRQDLYCDNACVTPASALSQLFFLDDADLLDTSKGDTCGMRRIEWQGVLLCGDSGAGKSTLSYACARAGWEYVTDDGSFLFDREHRNIVGNCHQVRFRPSAADLFPEVRGLDLTPRAAGKPSIELSTLSMGHVKRRQSVRVDFIVFLNRTSGGPPELVPYREDVARLYMRQGLYGTPESLAKHCEAVEQMLTAEVFELRYTDLNWAINRLRKLVQEGR